MLNKGPLLIEYVCMYVIEYVCMFECLFLGAPPLHPQELHQFVHQYPFTLGDGE